MSFLVGRNLRLSFENLQSPRSRFILPSPAASFFGISFTPISFDSFRSLILPALLAGFSAVSFAGTLSVSGSAPAVDGEDIANSNPGSASDAGGDQGHIWSNRPLQGQTFTTGVLAGGYLLKSVTLQNLDNNIGSSAVFTVRVGTVLGTVFSVVQSESTTNSVSYSSNDYITFTFTTPIALSPNTVYSFDWDATGSRRSQCN